MIVETEMGFVIVLHTLSIHSRQITVNMKWQRRSLPITNVCCVYIPPLFLDNRDEEDAS